MADHHIWPMVIGGIIVAFLSTLAGAYAAVCSLCRELGL